MYISTTLGYNTWALGIVEPASPGLFSAATVHAQIVKPVKLTCNQRDGREKRIWFSAPHKSYAFARIS